MKMRIFAVILAMAAVVGMLCGCQGGSDDPTNGATEPAVKNYTVKVADQNGFPVANAIFQWVMEDGSTKLAITGNDGVLQLETETTVTGITLTSAPEGYTAAQSSYNFDDSKELSVVLTAENQSSSLVTYSITVVDQDGNPVSGVVVQVCDEENCKLPMTTGETGTVTAEYEPSEYHVTLNTLPDGYTSQITEFYFDGTTTLTIVVTSENEG